MVLYIIICSVSVVFLYFIMIEVLRFNQDYKIINVFAKFIATSDHP